MSDFNPLTHKYTTHPTYTGPGCAFCGQPEPAHRVATPEELARTWEETPPPPPRRPLVPSSLLDTLQPYIVATGTLEELGAITGVPPSDFRLGVSFLHMPGVRGNQTGYWCLLVPGIGLQEAGLWLNQEYPRDQAFVMALYYVDPRPFWLRLSNCAWGYLPLPSTSGA